MIVIAVTGLARSGKDSLAEYLVKKYGFKRFDFFADIVVPLMQEKGIQPTKANAALTGNQMREKHGKGVFGKTMAKKIRGCEKVVITGVRSMEEIPPIKENSSKFLLIGVKAQEEKRFLRRSEKDPAKKTAFFERDETDVKNKGLGKVLSHADTIIENNSTLNDFYKAIDEVMRNL